MKRFLLMLLASAVLLMAVAGSASATTDYRPWKKALYRAYVTYIDRYWVQVDPWTQVLGRNVGFTIPEDFTWRTDKWDWDTCVLGTLITCAYGAFPNGEWGPQMRRFLRPFLRPHPPEETYRLPWVVELLALPDGGGL